MTSQNSWSMAFHLNSGYVCNETEGGFPIEIESQISLLITYSLAIFIL